MYTSCAKWLRENGCMSSYGTLAKGLVVIGSIIFVRHEASHAYGST